MPKNEKIDISPSSKFFATLSHFPYKPYFALSEFVDNSLQSFFDNQGKMKTPSGNPLASVVVKIDIDRNEKKITIQDNAAGISDKDLARAFKTAETPPDPGTGLSEFGIGMKYAAFHFCPKWTVITSALGEPKKKTITMDLNEIVHKGISTVQPKLERENPEEHYTHVILENCYDKNFPKAAATIAKIKRHMSDIYRLYLKDQSAIIQFKGEKLRKHKYETYSGPFYPKRDSLTQEVDWIKEFEIDLGTNDENGKQKIAKGWVGMRETGTYKTGGLPIFRNRRMFVGSGDDPHHPEVIYGSGGGTYAKIRLIGEVNLTNFPVSHTKDAVLWSGSEERLYKELQKILKGNEKEFLKLLKQGVDLDDERTKSALPLQRQITSYRDEDYGKDKKKKEKIIETADRVLEEIGEEVIDQVTKKEPTKLKDDVPENLDSLARKEDETTEKTLEKDNIRYKFKIAFGHIPDPINTPLYVIASGLGIDKKTKERILEIKINDYHGLFVLFSDESGRESLIRMICLLALSEQLARESNPKSKKAIGSIRNNVNLFAEAFSKSEK